jgi:F5/8 type C domain
VAWPNIALMRIATASSVYSSFSTPEKAVDGNLNSDYEQKSCFHSENDQNPWWSVDLGAAYFIKYVILTNRGDCCGKGFISTFAP